MAVFPRICGEPQVRGSHQKGAMQGRDRNFLGRATRAGGWMSLHVERTLGVFKLEHSFSLSTLGACSISFDNL